MNTRIKQMTTMLITLFSVTAFAQDLPKVAVYVAGGQDAAEHRALSAMVLEAFVNSRRYTAIERADAFTTEIDREQSKQRSGAVDDAQISLLGKQSGVDFVCVVDATHVLNEYHLSARLINVETANVVSMSTTDSPLNSLAELRKAANELVGGLLGTTVQQAVAGSDTRQQQNQPPQQQQDLADLYSSLGVGSSPPASSTATVRQSPQQQQQARPQPQPQQSQPRQIQSWVHQHEYRNFTTGERWATFGLNYLIPGLGSGVIMKDIKGTVTQIALGVTGTIIYIYGFLEYDAWNRSYAGRMYFGNDRPPPQPEINMNLMGTGMVLMASNFVFNIVRSSSYDRPTPKITAIDIPGDFNIAVIPDRHGALTTALTYKLEF